MFDVSKFKALEDEKLKLREAIGIVIAEAKASDIQQLAIVSHLSHRFEIRDEGARRQFETFSQDVMLRVRDGEMSKDDIIRFVGDRALNALPPRKSPEAL